MQIDINTTTYSIKQRILAFFMAFMIFTMTCPEIFEGLGVGLIVHATNSPIDIHSDVKDGSVMQGTTSGIYTYTGKFAKAAVSMFDYVSDEEINGTVVESHTNSYNNIWHNIPNGGYDDAFSKLNKKISVSYITAGTGNSLTIRYRKSNVSGTEGGNEPYHNVTGYVAVYIFGGDTGELWSWNTAKTSHKMTYRSQFDDYEYVLDLSNSKFDNNKKAGNIIFIFEDGNQTEDLTLNVGRSDCGKYYNYTYQNWSNNTKVNATCEVENGISLYSIPLYFGTFYNGNNYLRDNNSQIMYDYRGGSKPGSVSQYTSSNSNYRKYNMVSGIKDEHDNYGNDITIRRKNFYNNFWWRANIGLKPQGTTADLNNSVARGNASVQGLVGQTLSGGDTGNLTDPSNSSIVLPYLNETWSKSNSDVVKYYNADSNGGGVINFPFYEVKAAASGNVGNSSSSNIQGTYDGNYYGTGASTTQYARFYQFDSSESNLYFHTDVTNNKGYFSETTTPIKSNLGNVGFFPFNSSNSSYGKANNRGFGAKYEMQFKLKNDGCVGVVDSSGNDLDPSEYKTRIDTIFDFVGDDDLWVFVDGTLILDMGGSHNKSAGSINFKTKQATVKRAVSIGSTDSDKDDLYVNGDVTTDSITTKLQTANSKTFVDNDPSKGYNENTTHTMTIFYMERGMNDSNLKIRFNYSPEANFSKMKITEYTDFSGVNDGLVSYTKKAAEDDIFKYTVSNKNTSKSDIYNSSAKYPTAEARIRTNEADSNLTTKLVNGSSQTQTISNFNPPGTFNATTGIWSKVGEFKLVSGTSYLWVDGFANNKKMVGITTGSNASNTTGDGDSGGELYLMYGTNNDIYNSKAEGQESSAEFEKQFSKNSTMLVLQDSDLYSPKRMDGSTPVSPGLISNTNGNLFSALTDNGRDVADYYTTTVRLVDREFAENKTLVDDGVNDSANNTLNNGGQFLFANDPNGSSADLPVMLTEYFTNAVNTNTLEIKKVVSGTAPAGTTGYNFTLQLKDVFGTDVSVSDYSGIKAKKTGDTTAQTYINSSGNFILTAGESLTIEGIPYGTKYKITETNPNDGATITYSTVTTDGNGFATLTADKTGNNAFTVTNTYPSETGVDVLKKNGSNTPLEGAELELWYKETSTPPTYHFNDPKVVPYKMNGMKISKSPSEIGIPGLEEVRSSYTVYTEKTSYSNPDVPSSKDTDWILPRSDSDYIYFRDYNVGQYTADNDKVSFHSNTANSNAGKRSWRETFFADKSDGTHQQDQELGFADNDNYWYAAEFYGPNKKTVKYAMWERFVDEFTYNEKYTNAPNVKSHTVDTVVWKIQPPDGYTQVRFILLDGDNWIRSTEKFTFNLGEIYHKTSWGGVYSNGNYYDVPVNKETENTDDNLNRKLWAHPANDTPDNRNTAMDQPRKYEPTTQKVIFYCNSTQVWHNIHIEFFKQNNTSGAITEDGNKYDRVNGQAFPGYMMEPYAYAESNYRLISGGIEQYLTYELTIPKGATHFRINNGVASGSYAYMTKITQLSNETGVKNGGNYWVLNANATNTTSCSSGTLVTLIRNVNTITGLSNEKTDKTYSESNITSDCDYVYFDATSAGWDKVYAYFYGGGNLRDDNWQRACYSAWPGVAPVGTDYWSKDENNASTANFHSNTYSIQTTDGKYNGTDSLGTLSPEASFTLNGHTIYRFRVPKGDDKNYRKVVFNDGLKNFGGGHETGVIDYQAGYIYNESGTATQYYKYSPTVTYTGRTNSKYTTDDKTEYVYVKNSQNWKNLHITFYDSNGNRILQDGCGYLMDYAGKLNNVEYYRMPIPTNAAKFSVNQGKDTTATPMCDIIRLNAASGDDNGKPKTTQAATDKFVYDLSGNALTRMEYSKSSSSQPFSTTTGQTESTSNYTNGVRSSGSPAVQHTLNIRDSATTAWNVPIGGMTVTFYNASGTIVGSGTMMKTNPDGGNKVWYTKKIPEGAKSFSVIYVKNGTTTPTPTYPIYSTSADANGNITTSGHMYYETSGTNQLNMIHTESAVEEADDETYEKRGDSLYLRYDSKQTPVPTVTFYGGSNVIRANVTAKYLNEDDNHKHWYEISIPKGADYFSIGNDSTQYPIYELKTKYSRYQKDYTLGNMQYSVSGTTATLLYPIFEQDDEYSISVGGNTISTVGSIIPVDESQVSAYANADAEPRAATTSQNVLPVLYETDSTNVTYTWGSSTDDMLRFERPSGWLGTPTAQFYNGNSTVGSAVAMTEDTAPLFKVAVPETGTTYDGVKFTCGSNSTSIINLSNYNGGKNYTISLTIVEPGGKVRFDNSTTQWENVYVHFWNGSTESGTWYAMTDSDGDDIYEYTVPSGTYDHVRFSSDQSTTTSNPRTLALSKSNGGKNALFTPSLDDYYIYVKVDSSAWNTWNSRIYAYFFDKSPSGGEYAAWGIGCVEFNLNGQEVPRL